MRFYLLFSALLCVGIAAVGQSVVSIGSSPDGRYVVDALGVPLANGSLVWVGSFDSVPPITLTTSMAALPVADMIQMYQWTLFGEIVTQSVGGNLGKIAGDVTNNTDLARSFGGKQIFLWIFNAPTVNEATEFGIYSSWAGDTLWNFAQLIPDRARISINDSQLVGLVGSVSGNEIVLTTIVPEPAVYATFFALGVLAVALVRPRRKR